MGQDAGIRHGVAHHPVCFVDPVRHRYCEFQLTRRPLRSTFTRDAKHVHEREQALRLIRSVITLPLPPLPPPSSSRPASSRAHGRHPSHSRSRSRTSHSRQASNQDPFNAFSLILIQRVALTDGILRSLVSVAENPDDALRTICMQTLIEVGKSTAPEFVNMSGNSGQLIRIRSGRCRSLDTDGRIPDCPACPQGRTLRARTVCCRAVGFSRQHAAYARAPHARIRPRGKSPSYHPSSHGARDPG